MEQQHTDPVHSNSILVPFRFVRWLDLSRENESLIHDYWRRGWRWNQWIWDWKGISGKIVIGDLWTFYLFRYESAFRRNVRQRVISG